MKSMPSFASTAFLCFLFSSISSLHPAAQTTNDTLSKTQKSLLHPDPVHMTDTIPPAFSDPLPPRPRLILTEKRLSEIKAFISNNTDAALFYRNLVAQGEWVLSVPAIPVHKENHTNDLGGARQVLQRVYALALLWRITDNETWADRCVDELTNLVMWHDWALPVDALVTGELQHTLAIGIDWLDAYWLSDDFRLRTRTLLVDGLVNLGMKAMRVGYEGPPYPPWANNNTFINTINNYGEVVNGGTIIGVLALLGEPETLVPAWITNFIFPSAFKNLLGSFKSFSPSGDGSWYEGPNYHGYVVRYAVPLIWALQSVLGDDYGLLGYPGLESSALSTVYHITPQYKLWNWADAEEAPETTASSLALADHFGHKGAAYSLRKFIRDIYVPPSATGNPSMQASLGLLYFTSLGEKGDLDLMPRDRFFPGRNLAIFWSDFSDPNATVVGIKAGTCAYNVHLHQDMGSFIFHSHGQRIFTDLGMDNYALPCYFCLPQRYHFYRIGAFGHNTLTFNGRLFDYPSSASINVFNSTTNYGPPLLGADAWAAMDLSSMYSRSLKISWQRGIILMNNRSTLIVIDEIDTGSEAREEKKGAGRVHSVAEGEQATHQESYTVSPVTNLTWASHTNATVEIVGTHRAVIVKEGIEVELNVLPSATTCPGLSLSVVPVSLAPPQLSSDGIVRIQLFTDKPGLCQRIAVAIGVANTEPMQNIKRVPRDLSNVNPMKIWRDQGPFFTSLPMLTQDM